MTPDGIERLERRFETFESEVRGSLLLLAKVVNQLEVRVHSPGECDLKKTVEELRGWKDRLKGQLALLGFAVLLLPSIIGGLIVKFLK